MVVLNKCSGVVSVFCSIVLLVAFFFAFLRPLLSFSSGYLYSFFYAAALSRAGFRSEPVKSKELISGKNDLFEYGCCSMQGWRKTMEDAHTLLLQPDIAFFAVFDGHGGDSTAKYCASNLHKVIFSLDAFRSKDIVRALHDGFVQIDKQLYQTIPMDRAGCTAVALCIHDNILYCANAGDSRCVLCRNGEAFPLSNDHKPFNPTEECRIQRAGGFVCNRRVNGILALSRAIGDFRFKTNTLVPWEEQAVTCVPEVQFTRLQPGNDSFAIVACDGIWDVKTNEEAVKFVKHRMQMGMPLEDIAADLITHCLSPNPMGRGTDNMTVVIVKFKNRRKEHDAGFMVLESEVSDI